MNNLLSRFIFNRKALEAPDALLPKGALHRPQQGTLLRAARWTIREINAGELDKVFPDKWTPVTLYLGVEGPSGWVYDKQSTGFIKVVKKGRHKGRYRFKNAVWSLSKKGELKKSTLFLPNWVVAKFSRKFTADITRDVLLQYQSTLKDKLAQRPGNSLLQACIRCMDSINRAEGVARTFPRSTGVFVVDIKSNPPKVVCMGKVESTHDTDITIRSNNWALLPGQETSPGGIRERLESGAADSNLVVIPQSFFFDYNPK